MTDKRITKPPHDLIVKRWQDFAGKQAVHEDTGKTFEELSNGR